MTSPKLSSQPPSAMVKVAEAEVWGAWETPAAAAARPAAVAPREAAMESVVVVQGELSERRQEWSVADQLATLHLCQRRLWSGR